MSDDPSEGAASRLAAAADASRAVAALDRLGDRLSRAGDRSTRVGARTRRLVTDSAVYRWLAADPDPEVVVIDLRETYTLGPVVAVIDRLASWLAAATATSRTVALARGLRAELRAAPVRSVGVAVAVAGAGAVLVGAVRGALTPGRFVGLAVLAGLGLLGTQVSASWRDLADSRIGRLLAAALEPPPSDASGSTTDRDDEEAPKS